MPQPTDSEIWEPIPTLRGEYEASSLGRIRSRKPGRKPCVLTASLFGGRTGPGEYHYLTVITSVHGQIRNLTVHSLVALAFHGNPPSEGMHVCHTDGDHLNNTPENLRWGTPVDNAADMARHNRHRNGRKTHCVRGHEFTPENTGVSRTGGVVKGRRCLRCQWLRNNKMI